MRCSSCYETELKDHKVRATATIPNLENLLRTGYLKPEPRNEKTQRARGSTGLSHQPVLRAYRRLLGLCVRNRFKTL